MPSSSAPSSVIKIAVAQSSPVELDLHEFNGQLSANSSPFPTLEANLLDAAKRVEEAASQGADVVVFPEYFLQSFVNNGRQFLTLPGTHLEAFLSKLAQKYKISIAGTIVYGSIPEEAGVESLPEVSPFAHLLDDSKPQGLTDAQRQWATWLEKNEIAYRDSADHAPHHPVLHNTAFFIDETGKRIGTYVKRNLWIPERHYLTPGETMHTAFETKWGKAGFLICWDQSHGAAGQYLADQGVDLIFAPTFWLGTDSEPELSQFPHEQNYEFDMVQALAYARSFETETVYVLCNAGGPVEKGFMGGSAVWAPLRGKVDGFGDSEVGVKVVEVDMGVLKVARGLYHVQEDWRHRLKKVKDEERRRLEDSTP